jgi:hypothetical protein
MELYPAVLVSCLSYPDLNSRDVSSYYFLRRTEEDIYPLLEKFKPLEVIDKILPNITKRDVFVFSVSLYGYYDENHLSLKVCDDCLNSDWDRTHLDFPAERISYFSEKAYPLFLCAAKLYEYPFVFNDEQFILSFWHKPTIVNYWHFQLFTCDSKGQHLPREPNRGEKETIAEKNRLRHIAVSVLEYLISEAICSKAEAKRFHWKQ